MNIATTNISDEEFRAHLNLIRHLQHQIPSNAVRLILTDGKAVDGLITIISGNFFDIETLPGTSRIQMFSEVLKLEYPAGSEI